jgi:hypothetical protein
MLDSESRRGGYGCFVWLGLLVLVVAGILLWFNTSISRPGQIVLLRGKDTDKIVFMGTTQADGQELETLVRANDDLGLRKIESSDSVLSVAAGTRCRVLEHDWFKSLYRVRVLEGKEMGKSGWVGREFLSQPLK